MTPCSACTCADVSLATKLPEEMIPCRAAGRRVGEHGARNGVSTHGATTEPTSHARGRPVGSCRGVHTVVQLVPLRIQSRGSAARLASAADRMRLTERVRCGPRQRVVHRHDDAGGASRCPLATKKPVAMMPCRPAVVRQHAPSVVIVLQRRHRREPPHQHAHGLVGGLPSHHQPRHQRIVHGLPPSAHQPHRGGGLE